MFIGILQGRLSPSPSGSLQNFPKDWEAEFAIAQNIGFTALELLFPKNNYDDSPLLSSQGIKKIIKLKKKHQINTPSICCDCFMKGFLFGSKAKPNVELLIKLLGQAKKINSQRLVLPFLEDSELNNETKKKEVISNMNAITNKIAEYGIELVLETSLPAPELKEFISQFTSPLIKVCYDMGNTTTFWGDKVANDVIKLENLITSIHVKDRKYGSNTSYPLGEGGTDFEGIFKSLNSIKYQGPFIIEAARVSGRDEIIMAQEYLKFTKNLINKYLNNN